MNTFTSLLSLFLAIQASSASKQDTVSNESPAPIKVNKHFVEKAYLRGINEDNELVATDGELGETLSSERQWLTAHNDRRMKYHEEHGVTFVPLTWSPGLEDMAREWAEKKVENCQLSIAKGEPYGVNGQKHGKGSEQKRNRSINGSNYGEESLGIWENKLDKGYPVNKAMTQALWRATKYVGCATAINDDETCILSFCYYAKPGNCGMGQFRGENNKWKVPTYADTSGCKPECPPEGCN